MPKGAEGEQPIAPVIGPAAALAATINYKRAKAASSILGDEKFVRTGDQA